MKNTSKFGCITLFVILLLMLTRCSACSSSNSENASHEDGIYEVEITKTSSEDGDFILKGKTDAPDGSKILAQGNLDESENEAESIDYGEYAKVKNHKFSARVEAGYLTDSDVKEGQKLKVRIFAIKKYAVKFDDYKITKKVRRIITKQIDPVTLTVNKQIADYYTDNDDDSDETDDTDSDDSDSNSTDDSEKEKSEDENKEEDKDTSKSEDSNKSEKSQVSDDNNNENAESAGESTDTTNSASNETQAGKVYTGNSNKIVGNARTHKYHVPGQAGYTMNSGNAVYFNSEEEAQAAGYVRSKR